MNELKLKNNWTLIPSEKINQSIEKISSSKFDTIGWYKTKVPSTVLASLVENGVYNNPYFGTRRNDIPTEQF